MPQAPRISRGPRRRGDQAEEEEEEDEPQQHQHLPTTRAGAMRRAAADAAGAAAAARARAAATTTTAAPPPPLPSAHAHAHLAHATFGSPCPRAPLVFFNHGWPGSRLGAAMLHRAALRLGVRVVGVDRPGFGGTPFCPAHGFETWARRLAALADHLGARRYAILGVSGGGPFALAAARHAPDPDRIAGLALLCPIAPPRMRRSARRAGERGPGVGGSWCLGGGGGGCLGGGGGVVVKGEDDDDEQDEEGDDDDEEEEEAKGRAARAGDATASWALQAAERHPRTARAALLVARALLSPTLVGEDATPQQQPPQQRLPWATRLLQRLAMGGREAAAAEGAAPAAAADIWRAVAEGLRGGGRGMLHEIRLVSRAAATGESEALVFGGSPPSRAQGGAAAVSSASSSSSSSSSASAPYFCWIGADDAVAPARKAELFYGRAGAGCEFRVFAGETHTSLVIGRLGDALAELVKPGVGGRE